eukprot:TRINITY_DN1876_c0_g1_i2.p1 TRINITY_DN1876_c0_g1~~TRINITY_DN1876_c0_g1_i2.p1  ORF type:complete len:236 (-),score=35.83 TRINITY_DN1876_c0_g1_i2:58-765(-)
MAEFYSSDDSSAVRSNPPEVAERLFLVSFSLRCNLLHFFLCMCSCHPHWLVIQADTVGRYVLFLVYNPLKAKNRMQFVLSIVMFVVLILFCLIIAFVAIALMHEYGWDSGAAQGYATGLGYLTVAATVIQWMPQIITTLIRKSKGVLSVPMLLIQAPGTALVVIFQAGINRAALTTWLPFLFSCVQQTVLLIICFVFWFRDRRARKRVEIRPSLLVNADEASDEEEKMPLIEKAG